MHLCCIGTPLPKTLIRKSCSTHTCWQIKSNPCKCPRNWFSSPALASHATALSWPSSFFSKFGVWLPVYHRSWILCLKYLDNLYNCCPFAHMCSCQVALIHRSLKTQEFGLALALAPTKPQLDLHNIPTKSHMNKHIHMPTHTNTDGSWRK